MQIAVVVDQLVEVPDLLVVIAELVEVGGNALVAGNGGERVPDDSYQPRRGDPVWVREALGIRLDVEELTDHLALRQAIEDLADRHREGFVVEHAAVDEEDVALAALRAPSPEHQPIIRRLALGGSRRQQRRPAGRPDLDRLECCREGRRGARQLAEGVEQNRVGGVGDFEGLLASGAMLHLEHDAMVLHVDGMPQGIEAGLDPPVDVGARDEDIHLLEV